MKRLLFEVHRWVGVVMAVFMLMWFVSGLLIVFSGQITLHRDTQLAHAETLKLEAGWMSLGEAWKESAEARKAATRKDRASQGRANDQHGGKNAEGRGQRGAGADAIIEARLVRIAGEPLWLVEDGRNRRFAISAIDGKLQEVSSTQALKIASRWLEQDGRTKVSVSYLESIDSASSLRNYRQLKPFHRIAVDDGSGTELLISARTGEVLQAATRIERGLYYAGNWLHMLRPLDAIGYGDIREDVLTWAGFIAFVGALTGMIIGWLRWRPGWFGHATYSEGRKQPYRAFWFKWHFWSGLIGGTFALLWAFSGFIDNNPLKLFNEGNLGREEIGRYLGSEVPAVMRHWKPAATDLPGVVELSWRRLGEGAVLLAYGRDGRRSPVAVDGAVHKFDQQALLAGVHRLAGDATIANQVTMQAYDNYYYLRHHRDAASKPLPVVRVELGDAAATHLYIDPQDGRLLLKRDNSSRQYRWLYSGLHHWDFGWLYQRPLWDGWMVTWILFGLVLSVSSVVVGWKRVVLTLKPAKRKAPKNQTIVPELASEGRNA